MGGVDGAGEIDTTEITHSDEHSCHDSEHREGFDELQRGEPDWEHDDDNGDHGEAEEEKERGDEIFSAKDSAEIDGGDEPGLRSAAFKTEYVPQEDVAKNQQGVGHRERQVVAGHEASFGTAAEADREPEKLAHGTGHEEDETKAGSPDEDAQFLLHQRSKRIGKEAGRETIESFQTGAGLARRGRGGGRTELFQAERAGELRPGEQVSGRGPGEQDEKGRPSEVARAKMTRGFPGEDPGEGDEPFQLRDCWFGDAFESDELGQHKHAEKTKNEDFTDPLALHQPSEKSFKAARNEQVESTEKEQREHCPEGGERIDDQPGASPEEDKEHFDAGGQAKGDFEGEKLPGGDGVHKKPANVEEGAGRREQDREQLPEDTDEEEAGDEGGFEDLHPDGTAREQGGTGTGTAPEETPEEAAEPGEQDADFVSAKVEISLGPKLGPEDGTKLGEVGRAGHG